MRDRTDVENIRSALSTPRDVAQRLGLQGKAVGAGYTVRCPAHGDRTPSCSLTRGPDGTLRVHCFGGCDLSGDIFSLVAAVERLDLGRDFPAVLEAAARLAGVTISTPSSRAAGYVPVRLPAPPPPAPAGPPPLSDEVFDELVKSLLWTGRLDDSPIATDVSAYLRDRGLLEPAIAEGWAAFPVPECQGQWVKSIVDIFGDDVVARSGLVRINDDGEPDFRAFVHRENRLVIPWRNPQGLVSTLQRRRLDSRKDRPKYAFATGRSPVDPYGIEHLVSASSDAPIAFVEGAVDVLALRELLRRDGTPAVVLGIPGVASWSKDRGARWAALASGRVAAVALDADVAGRAAVAAMAEDLVRARACRVEGWTPPLARKDWAELLVPAPSLKEVA